MERDIYIYVFFLAGETPTEMQNGCFRAVVSSLQLRDVDNVGTHGCRGDERAGFLLLEVFSGRVRTVIHRVEVGIDNLMVVRVVVGIENTTFSPRNTGIGDENVQTTAEMRGHHFVNCLFGGFLRGHVVGQLKFVGWACTISLARGGHETKALSSAKTATYT